MSPTWEASEAEANAQAGELRAAAGRMRAQAGRADAGPWRARNLGRHDRSAVVTVAIGAPILIGSFEGARGAANGYHAAGMHPGVAMVVAAWLDVKAANLERVATVGHHYRDHDYGYALAVARAYLGEGEPTHG